MKKILTTLVLAAGMAITASAQYQNTTIKVGQKAPELAYETPDGKVLKLSEVNKDHVVLIDFWASWCGPCRMSNPGLVKIYNEYKAKKFKGAKKGFTVYSVSLDQSKDKWVKAIADDKLVWTSHVSDLGGWRSAAAAKYGIQYIPQAFLVDGSGNIVGTYSRAEEALADLEKLAAK